MVVFIEIHETVRADLRRDGKFERLSVRRPGKWLVLELRPRGILLDRRADARLGCLESDTRTVYRAIDTDWLDLCCYWHTLLSFSLRNKKEGKVGILLQLVNSVNAGNFKITVRMSMHKELNEHQQEDLE